jgi:hypothetical protein
VDQAVLEVVVGLLDLLMVLAVQVLQVKVIMVELEQELLVLAA